MVQRPDHIYLGMGGAPIQQAHADIDAVGGVGDVQDVEHGRGSVVA
jgi:hypothetical protein